MSRHIHNKRQFEETRTAETSGPTGSVSTAAGGSNRESGDRGGQPDREEFYVYFRLNKSTRFLP